MELQENYSIDHLRKNVHFNRDYLEKYTKYLDLASLVAYNSDSTPHYNLELDQFYRVTGRIMAKRNLGCVQFMDIYNYNTLLQLIFEKNSTVQYSSLIYLSRGDIISVEGRTKLSQNGVLSLSVTKWGLISKTLMEHPDKIKKIQDKSVYKQKRYLEFIYDSKLNYNLRIRMQCLKAIRAKFNELNYLEMDAPILGATYGGANATPFTTTLKETKAQLYMGIAPEFKLKDLIFAGFDKVYTLIHNFRNEGIDKTHHPQFTGVEWYAQNMDYTAMIHMTMDIIKYIVKQVKQTYSVLYNGQTIDLEQYTITTYTALLDLYYPQRTLLTLTKVAEQNNLITTNLDLSMLEFSIFECCITPQLIQPTFVVDYPCFSTPLAKYSRRNNKYVEQAQLYIAGMELANIYSEENNVHELCSKKETRGLDSLHLDMLSYGQYIHGGAGIGFDRLCMLLANEEDIRKVIFYNL